MLGMVGASGTFGAVFFVTPELFPTNMITQATGLSSCSLHDRPGEGNLWSHCRTTTSRKSPPSIWFCVCEVASRSLWRPWLAKPSLWKWSPQTLLKMWRPRFRIKKAFPQTSSVLSLLASSWRMAALCLTTTSRRSPLSTWCCVSVVAAHFRLF